MIPDAGCRLPQTFVKNTDLGHHEWGIIQDEDAAFVSS